MSDEKQPFTRAPTASTVISLSGPSDYTASTVNNTAFLTEKEAIVSPLNSHDAITSTEKEVTPVTEGKQVLPPINDTDKQTFSRTADSSKEVANSQPNTDLVDRDTSKIFVPQPPPISMDKELAPPLSGEPQSITEPSQSIWSLPTAATFPLTTSTSTSSSTLPKLHAAFRLEKKHALGLIWYQNQQIAVRAVDLSSGIIGGAVWVTSSMAWLEAMLVQPPMFELFIPGGGAQVARFVPQGVEGLVSMKGRMEVLGVSGMEGWGVRRRGLVTSKGRWYDLWRGEEMGKGVKGGLVWKGSTRAVREGFGGGEGVKHGGLKLVDEERDGEVLALWNQWRDSETLGDLMVFEGVKGKVAVEAVVTSAIAVIHAERVTGMNWVGGLGK